MPVTLKLTFPGGRYHATPWGRHVNEGVPEWPPSPWRLLRALVAVWKRTLPELTEEQVKRVLTALADPPVFRLPPYKVAHTRHYMPWEKKGPADRTLVFDTFVSVGRGDPLYVCWPGATLDDSEWKVLGKIVSNITTLGRAEGWVEAELCSAGLGAIAWNSIASEPTDTNPVPVLCPDGAEAFADTHYPKHDPKKLKQGKVNPKDFLFACPRWHLCLDTETIHSEKWPRVPGATWVNYTAPQPAGVAAPRRSAPEKPRPTVARFLLDGPVLPLVTDTVLVAEAVRHELLKRFQRECYQKKYGKLEKPYREQFRSAVLSGKDAAGNFLRSHGHAHYLPTAEGADVRRVTHVTVWAKDGFDPAEVAALTGLRSVRIGEGNPLQVQLVGLGETKDFTAKMFGPARVWVSETPVVGPGHVGRSGRDRAFRKSVRRELRRMVERGVWATEPAFEFLPPQTNGVSPQSVEFRRSRSRGGAGSGWDRPFGVVCLTFPEPVSGPVCVGYACHYGLGRFAPG